MGKRKRGLASLIGEDDPDLLVKVRSREDFIKAHVSVVGLFSRLVKDLPKSMDGSPTIWDLSSIMLEGESEPVSSSAVELWLDCLYARVDRSRRVELPRALNDARPLLLFADFAGTVDAVVDELESGLISNAALCLAVPLGQARNMDLALRGRIYYTYGGRLQSAEVSSESTTATVELSAEDFAAHKEQFPVAMCSALEEWLYLAGRLGLVELARLLLDFIKLQLFAKILSVCLHSVDSVFSPRVLCTMPRELLLEGFLHHSLGPRSSDAIVTQDGLELQLLSPSALAWFGPTVRRFKVLAAADKTCVVANEAGNVDMSMSISLGGLSDQQRDRIVQAALAKAGDSD